MYYFFKVPQETMCTLFFLYAVGVSVVLKCPCLLLVIINDHSSFMHTIIFTYLGINLLPKVHVYTFSL